MDDKRISKMLLKGAPSKILLSQSFHGKCNSISIMDVLNSDLINSNMLRHRANDRVVEILDLL